MKNKTENGAGQGAGMGAGTGAMNGTGKGAVNGAGKGAGRVRLFSKLNKRFFSKFDVLGSYTGNGEGDFVPETDVDDL